MTDAGGLSYSKGPTDVPLLDLTIGQALDEARQKWPDELALVSLTLQRQHHADK